jgi:hypothetical protein
VSKEDYVRTLITVLLVCVGVASVAAAGSVPEIDPGSGANALALLAAAVFVFRGRFRK